MKRRQRLTTSRRAVLSIGSTAAIISLLLASLAHGQTADDHALQATLAIDPPKIDHVFGDWYGAQTALAQNGINLQIDAVTEFAGNTSGGIKQGSTFANQVGVQADVNWERAAGIVGLSTHAIIVSRSGSSDSALFGDNFSPVQEVYGSGGNVLLHLVSAYAQETMAGGRLDVAAGRVNGENDFASSPIYCDFVNNGLCGDPKALPGGDRGHSAFPDAVWAMRLQLVPSSDTSIKLGVYQVNQGLYGDANFRTGFKFDDSQTTGVYLPIELGWTPSFGQNKLPGHYKLGFGYDTSSGYKDFANPLAEAGIPGYTSASRSGNTQLWALADQMLLRTGTGEGDGLVALAGFVHNDPNNSSYAEEYFVAAVATDFWKARPKDAIGALFMYDTVSGRLAAAQAAEASFGLPLGNGATGVQRREMILEVNYDIGVSRGLKIEPDFQYVFRPNAQANIRDATVFGVKMHAEF